MESFGMDEYSISPYNETYKLFDYDNKNGGDEIYENMGEEEGNNNNTKESFLPIEDSPKNNNMNYEQKQPSVSYLIKELYNKISLNISYLFIIMVLIIVCIVQKNSIDQMKLILLLTLNKQDSSIKMPM